MQSGQITQKTLWQTNVAGWNIPSFDRNIDEPIRGPHFPASYVR